MTHKIEIKLLEHLKQFTETQFEELVYRFGIDLSLLPGKDAPPTKRIIEFLNLLKQQKRIKELQNFLFPVFSDSVQTSEVINLSHSIKRYNDVRQNIYPHLNIVDTILAGIGYEEASKGTTVSVEVSVLSEKDNNKETDPAKRSLNQAITELWNNPDKWHCVLIGDGGMGKTTSLLKLWEDSLNGDKQLPVPIFLSLESYNQIRPKLRREFIWYTIVQEYLNCKYSDEITEELISQFKQKNKVNSKEFPSIILLLDGFNEVTSDNRELLLCLNEIRKLKGVQIIISSRYDMRKNLNWSEFDALRLEPLDNEQIKTFIESEGIEFKQNLLKSIPLLTNPMMLTLYCGTEREMRGNLKNEEYDFIAQPRYKAEILHNFIESSLARLARLTTDKPEEDKVLHKLYLRHLLPKIGYEMEKNGHFEINRRDLMAIIKEEFARYCSNEFRDIYVDLDRCIGKLESQLVPGNRNNIIEAIEKLTKRPYCLLRELKGNNYAFLHQDFRDYFAAFYIKDRTGERIEAEDKTFPELASHVFEIHLRNMLGELTGEARRRPVIKGGYQKGEREETILDKALTLLRNEEMKDGDYRLLNILELMKEKREDLSDTDLSYLDLRHIVLNNVRLGHGKIKGRVSGASLKGSRLRAYTFLPHGHSDLITSISYSPDGTRFISSSKDKTIKEWDATTGECINIYKCNFELPNFVNSGDEWNLKVPFSVNYSPDGKKIIAAFEHGVIKEWNLITGDCIRTYYDDFATILSVKYSPCGDKIIFSKNNEIKELDLKSEKVNIYSGHINDIWSVSYSPDGDQIASVSEDGILKLWDTNKKQCLITYNTREDDLSSLCYSPNGRKILLGSLSGSIRELNLKTGKFVRSYIGDMPLLWPLSLCYSPDGKKIISGGAIKKIIEEWDVDTGCLIKTYKEYLRPLSWLNYSQDGERIISGYTDGTIKEWDAITGECIKTVQGFTQTIESVSYSPDTEKIVSGSGDYTIKEWNVNTGECIRIYTGHRDTVHYVSYSPDNSKILSCGSFDKTIKEWNTETGECIKTYKGDSNCVSCVCYKPDGKRIISGSGDGIITEWDTETGNCVRTYKGHKYWIFSICYSPDGKKIISLGGEIIKWDAITGELIKSYNFKSKTASLLGASASIVPVVKNLFLAHVFQK